uniref:Septin-5-like n=1 Tax=Stegastes partitus TaxID=144197 RepID=A0A3B4ZTZ9_9TELE
ISGGDQDKEYVGFATLPNQVHRKTVKKGFTFTLMVAGESGLGKSTLINSLFLTDLYKDRKVPNSLGVTYRWRIKVASTGLVSIPGEWWKVLTLEFLMISRFI